MIIKNVLQGTISRLYAAVCAALLAIPAQAALLNLTLADSPDIVSGFIDVSYDATTATFFASGFAFELKDGSGVRQINGGLFDLGATIDNSGILSGGTLTIGGTIAALGFNSGTLLTGTLTALGFPGNGGDPLEFLFDVTGGDAAGLYGSSAGIILSNSGFSGSFAADFDNLLGGLAGTGYSLADTAPTAMPVPAALWLFGSGLLWLAGMTRRRPTR